jgi:hypothetical protein
MAASFNSAIQQVLMAQTGGEFAELNANQKTEMVACVQQVLAKVPEGLQRPVTEASNIDEMQDRFGELVLAEQAKWKQRIAKACGHIAMKDG